MAPSIVLFYAEWCGHCQALKPTWARVEASLKAASLPCQKVESASIPASLGVRLFPTIAIVNNGRIVQEYGGDRTLESIVQFAKGNVKGKPAAKKAAGVPVAAAKKPMKKGGNCVGGYCQS